MLTENQEIIYRKKNNTGSYEEISRLTKDNHKELAPPVAAYVRYFQPFIKERQILTIPQMGNNIIRTSIVGEVKQKGNILVIVTENSVYEIEYKGINLEKMLADGEFKGVNEEIDEKEIAAFPKP